MRQYYQTPMQRITCMVPVVITPCLPPALGFGCFQEGVAIRAGHHCTQALHRQLGAAGSLRASLYLYNTKDDVDRFIEVSLSWGD